MKNSKLLVWGIINSFGAFLYILAVAFVMSYGNELFGKMQNLWGPVAFLLLFVLSATVEGALIFGRPILLYLGGKKTEAVKLLIYTILVFGAITLAVFFLLLVIR